MVEKDGVSDSRKGVSRLLFAIDHKGKKVVKLSLLHPRRKEVLHLNMTNKQVFLVTK